MIVRILLAALVAGLVSGLLVTGAQQARVVPLIIEAEAYEKAPAHHHDAVPQEGASLSDFLISPANAHEHAELVAATEAEGDATLFGMPRLMATLLANLVTACGYSLLLAGVALVLGQNLTLANGLAWGAAGWLVFHLMPSLGLPPELPGSPAADLASRQGWWFATVIATAAGLYGLVLRREAWAKIVGGALLIAPHLIGAPQPPNLETAVPAPLAAEFAVAALATGLFFWVVLGLLQGWLNERMAKA